VRDESRRKARAERAARPYADLQDDPRLSELLAKLRRLSEMARKSAKNPALTPSDHSVMGELVVEAASVYAGRRTLSRSASRSALHKLHKIIPLLEREVNNCADVLVAPLRERMLDELRKFAAAAPPPPGKRRRGGQTDEDFHDLIDRLASCWEYVTGEPFRQGNLPAQFVAEVVKLIDPDRLGALPKVMEKIVTERRKFPRKYRR
jgi:hypothetical protein